MQGVRAGESGVGEGSGPVAGRRHATLFPDPSHLLPSKSAVLSSPSLPVWFALEILFLAPLSPLISSSLLPPPLGRAPQTKGI